MEDILVTNEILDFAKREKKNFLLFKVDFAHAYHNTLNLETYIKILI